MFGFGKWDKEKNLIKTINKGYLLKAEQLLPQIKDPDFKGKKNLTVLLAATKVQTYMGAWSQNKTTGLCSGIVKGVLKMGADPDICDDQGRSPLMNAAIESNYSAFQLILESGADIDLKDKNNMTALMHAADWDNAHMVRLLLEKGADVQVTDGEGRTVLMIAVSKISFDGYEEQMSQIVQMLIDHDVNIHKVDDSGKTALSSSVDYENAKTVKTLIEAGANVHVENQWGISTLQWAKEGGYEEIISLLEGSTHLI